MDRSVHDLTLVRQRNSKHMKSITQVILLLAFVLVTPRAFPSAHANTCQTCYIDYENGNDSWSGTAETFQGGTTGPWKHAPGMLGTLPNGSSSGDGCAANCASQVPVAGDKYILKGGVVWPYTTLPWSFSWTGSSSTQKYGCAGPGCIYVGNAIGAGLQGWNKGIVNSITLSRDLGGWNPVLSPMAITCSGGGGSGAAGQAFVIPLTAGLAEPNVAGFIYHTAVTNQGSAYTSAPNCMVAGGGGTATLVADIDRAVIDAGATQSNHPDWPVGTGAGNLRGGPGVGVSHFDILYGIEYRNILQQMRTPAQDGGFLTPMISGGRNSSILHNYVHGRFVDCAYPVLNSCDPGQEVQDTAIMPFYPYTEVGYNIVENGDSFILGTAVSALNGICGIGVPCEYSSHGIETGTENSHGPVSIHNNVIYSDGWQIRIAGNAVSGNDPFVIYSNEGWLTLYDININAHINRRYSQLTSPATLVSYNNIDHNHVNGSGNQQQCNTGITFYFFNEVIWGTGTSTPAWGMNTGNSTVGGCTAYFYNDTVYNNQRNASYECLNTDGNSPNATKIVVQNLHCIGGGTSAPDPFWGTGSNITFADQAGSSSASAVQAASVVQGISRANAQGYSLSNLYAPSSGNGDTVTFANGNTSANLSSLCSGVLAALCSDVNGNPRSASTMWQSGAYVYGSGGGSPSVAPPTNLTAVVQ